MSSTTRTQVPLEVAAALRDLRKKIDRAAPTIKNVESGDLKVLSDAEKHNVEMYPKWKEQLEYIRTNNALPTHTAEAPTPGRTTGGKGKKNVNKETAPVVAAAASETEAAVVDDTPAAPEEENVTDATSETAAADVEETVAPTSSKVKGGMNKKKGGVASASGADTPVLIAKDVVSLAAMVVNTGDHRQARRALIDNFITSQLDHVSLRRLTKEYDELCTLRRDIVAGRIAKPTNVQKARIELIAVLQREMQLERSKMDSRTSRLRLHIKATIADVLGRDEVEIDELGYEVAPTIVATAPVTSAATVAPAPVDVVEEAVEETPSISVEVTPEEEEKETAAPAAEEEVATNEHPIPDNAQTEVEAVVEEPAAEEPTVAEVTEVVEESVAEEPEPEVVEPIVEKEKVDAVVEEEETPVPVEEEKPEEEEEELPPAPPREIDWSEITIIKNRIQLEQKVLTPVDLADMRRRREHSRDPSAARRRSASAANRAERVNPFVMDALTLSDDIIGQQSNKKGAPTATSTGKGASSPAGGKKGAGGADKKAASAHPKKEKDLTPLQASVVSRVLRDLKFCQRNALRTVRFEADESNVRCWYINVSPIDGPVAGTIIPLQMHFGDLYPQEAPEVQCMVSIPHPSIVNSRNLRDTLCFDHTRDSVWNPNYGAYSILSQLQNFFSTENFNGMKKGSSALTTSAIRQKLAVPLADLSRYSNPAIQHYPAHPNPPLPVFNGPFGGKTQVKVNASGELCGPGSATWLHAFAGKGHHSFKCKVIVPPVGAMSPKRKTRSSKKQPTTAAKPTNATTNNKTTKSVGIVEDVDATTAADVDAEDAASTDAEEDDESATTPKNTSDNKTPVEGESTTTTPAVIAATSPIVIPAAGFFIVGVVAPNGAGADRIGGDEYGWAFHTGNGTLKHNSKLIQPFEKRVASPKAQPRDSEDDASQTTASPEASATTSPSHSYAAHSGPITFPLGHGAVIEFEMDLARCVMDVVVDGIVVHGAIPISSDILTPPAAQDLDGAVDADLEGRPTYGLHPLIYFPQVNMCAEMEFIIHRKSLDEWQNNFVLNASLRSSSASVSSPRGGAAAASLEGTLNGTPTPRSRISPMDSPTSPTTPRRSVSSKSIKTMPPATSAGTLALPKLSRGRVATPGTVSIDTESAKAAADIEVALDVLGLKPLRCFVSLATQSESQLGLLVEVAQDSKNYTPINISTRNSQYISTEAFSQYKLSNKAHSGRRTQVFFPLMLGSTHAAKSIPDLKTAITNMCRNPDASTAYTPPFKPMNAPIVFASALFSVTDELQERLPSSKATSFTHIFHAALALMSESEQVKSTFNTIIDAAKKASSLTKAEALAVLPTEKHIILAIALSNVAYFPTAVGSQATEEWVKYLRGCVELAAYAPGGASKAATDATEETSGGDPLAALPVKRRKAVLRAIVFATAIRQSLHAAVLNASDPALCTGPFEALCSLKGFLRFSDLVWVKANEPKLSALSRWMSLSNSITEALEE